MGYLANFMVYTFAMVGIITIALLIFKKTGTFSCGNKSKYIKVMDTLTIGPRKTLYIVSAGKEKFLIAGDVGKTNLISKLDDTEVKTEIYSGLKPEIKNTENNTHASFQETMANLPRSKYMDRSNIGINSSMLTKQSDTPYTSVIRSLASKMQG